MEHAWSIMDCRECWGKHSIWYIDKKQYKLCPCCRRMTKFDGRGLNAKNLNGTVVCCDAPEYPNDHYGSRIFSVYSRGEFYKLKDWLALKRLW